MMNTIGDVELANRPPKLLRQDGYSGKNCWRVSYSGRIINVQAADETAAMFVAAKHWGYSFKRPEHHQNAVVTRLPYKPESLVW